MTAEHVLPVYGYVLLAVSIFLAGRLLANAYLSPLRHYPGPFLASCTRLWNLARVRRYRYTTEQLELHAEYGPVVRIAPNELSIGSPQVVDAVFAPGKGFTKSDWYSVFPPTTPKDIFTELDEKLHAQKKRVAGVPYSMKSMVSLIGATDKTIATLQKRFDGFAKSGEAIDLCEWIHYFTFDFLGEVAFSETFGFLETGSDIDNCIQTIGGGQYYLAAVAQVPWVDRIIRHPIWNLLPFVAQRQDLLVADRALAQVRKRMPFQEGRQQEQQDILHQLIQGHLKNPDRFAVESVEAVAIGAIFAGSDSTSSTTQAFFYHLFTNSRVLHKVLEELDAARQSGVFSTEIADYSETQHLKYFQAALKESMRLKPAFASDISRVVPKEGVNIHGYSFPGGTRLALNATVLHRDKGVFGPDADMYRPERWLEDEERARRMNRHMYQFGGGSHLCLGRNLALVEINRLVPALLLDYEFQLERPAQEMVEVPLVFVSRRNLRVRIRQREGRMNRVQKA